MHLNRFAPGSRSPFLTLMVLLPALIILAGVAAMAATQPHTIEHWTRDTTAIFKAHPLTGVLSNLGILLWWGTAAICLFSAAWCRIAVPGRTAAWLTWFGLLSVYLTMDDLFQIHEDLLVRYLGGLGLREIHAYIFVGSMLLGGITLFWRDIKQSSWPVLALAISLLSLSVACDTFLLTVTERRLGPWQTFVEDGFKWIGIACWSGYWTSTAYRAMTMSSALQLRAPGQLEMRGRAGVERSALCLTQQSSHLPHSPARPTL